MERQRGEDDQVLGIDPRALLRDLVSAARAAAAVITRFSAERSSIRWEMKAAADFVSVVDREAEQAIRTTLGIDRGSTAFGVDVRFLGEESAPDVSIEKGLAIVVDPLDGTTNFLHGYPEYAVSIAAVHDGEPIVGVVLNVVTGELFSAIQGEGATLDGKPIQVSTRTDPALALVGTGVPFRDPEELAQYLRQLDRVARGTAGVRRGGSAALDICDVAAGRLDAFWEPRLSPWDVAAGYCILREAGGVVTDIEGNRARVVRGSVVAGNPDMHAWLLETLQSLSDTGTP